MTQIVQTNADEAPKQPDQVQQAAPQPQPATAKYDRNAGMNADPAMVAPKKQGEHQATSGSPQLVDNLGAKVRIVGGEKVGGKLYITVEGPSIDVVRSLSARTLAYEARHDHGYSNAGLEAHGPPMPVDEEGKPLGVTKTPPKRYRAVYKLTPG